MFSDQSKLKNTLKLAVYALRKRIMANLKEVFIEGVLAGAHARHKISPLPGVDVDICTWKLA